MGYLPTLLKFFPLRAVNTGLLQYSRQEVTADVTMMRVWKRKPQFTFHHVLMFSSGMRASKSDLFQRADEVVALYRAKFRHYTISDSVSSDKLSTMGSLCPSLSPNTIQPSNTS